MAVQALAVPMRAGDKVLAQFGMTANQMAVDMQHGGLIPALQDLKDHLTAAGVTSVQTGQILTEIFGKRAGTGVAVLYDQLDRLKSKYGDIQGGAKNMASDWQAAQQTMSVQMDKLGATVSATAIRFGTALLPAASRIVGALTDVVDWIAHSHDALIVLAGVITAVTLPAVLRFAIAMGTTVLTAMFDGIAALTAYGVQLGVFGGEAQAAAAASAEVGTEMSASLGPIGLVAGAVTALMLAFRSNNEAVKQANTYTEAYITAALKTSDPLAVMEANLKSLQAALKSMPKDPYSGPDPLGIGNLFHQYDASKGAQKSISDLQKAIDQYKASQQANNDVAKQTANGIGTVTRAAADSAKALNDSKTALQALSTAMSTMTGGAVTAEADLIAFNQGLDDMTAKLKANADNLDINTQAGRDDMTSILNNVSAIMKLSDTSAKGGDSTATFSQKLHDQVGKLESVMSQAGLTKQQISDLIDQYKLTPTDLDTYVNLYGTSQASQALAGLQGQMDALRSLGESLPGLFGGVAGLAAQAQQNITANAQQSAAQAALNYHQGYGHNAGGTDWWRGGLTWVGNAARNS